MQTETIKRKLHVAIEEMNDLKTLKAVHNLLKPKAEKKSHSKSRWTPEQRRELDEQWKEVLEGKGKSYSLEEVLKIARKYKPKQ
ncbi:MAG TPA: hypothetical protein VE978_14845 [Chitinophagales bacterium]|nr:hypothetical protein [Chitinophagales bacterium]